jgi:protoheme IX farnesyltransferase
MTTPAPIPPATDGAAPTGAMEAAEGAGRQEIEWWKDCVSLTKPRVAALLLVTALVAMVLAAGGTPSLQRVSLTVLGGYLCAGGAGAINCYLDRDLDAQMARTCRRAIPSGRVAPARALALGILLALLSGPVLWFGAHPLAAVVALLAFAHYVLVYTLWLKRRSSWNVVVGGLAGAAPPLVGWAAETGTLSATAFLLAVIVFCWTPAHFWALALLRREEYARAGVPMLPVVRGARATRRQILAYTAITVLLTALPVVTGVLGVLYAVAAAVLGGAFLALALGMVHGAEAPAIRRFYFFTLFYLGMLHVAILVDWGLCR